MRRIRASIALLLLFSLLTATAQTTKPEQANRVLKAAIQQAESSNKAVFLIFHAPGAGGASDWTPLSKILQSSS